MTLVHRHDPVRLYAFALREGDERLAELLHRRLAHRLHELLARRVAVTLTQKPQRVAPAD